MKGLRINGVCILSLMLLGGMLVSCQSAPTTVAPAQTEVVENPTAAPPTETAVPTQPPPSPTPLPTNTPLPTHTPMPSETPAPTSTPLPEGVLFRDDFNGPLQPGWRWEDENPEKWTLNDKGWLEITGEYNALLSENQQNNLLWYPLPEGNFVITVHLIANPSADFQQAAIFIYEDPENYITINRGFCGPCLPGGNGFFMDYKISGKFGTYSAATRDQDVYLRLESKDKIISGYFATEPEVWRRLGRFGNYFQFQQVGIGVSNVRASSDLTAMFDYFEISLP